MNRRLFFIFALLVLLLLIPKWGTAQESYICGQLLKENSGLDQWFIPCSGNPPWLKLGYSQPTTPPGLVDGAYYRVSNPQLVQSGESCSPTFGCTTTYLFIIVDNDPYDNWEQISACEECNVQVTPLPPSPTIPPAPTPRPAQISFTADPDLILRGQCTTLRWNVEQVREVYLDGQGVIGHDTRQVCPQATTTYTLHVITDSGDVYRTVTVTVSEPPTPRPAQISFTADPDLILRGQCTTLRWNVEQVREVYLDGQGVIGHDTRQVCPQVATTYTLRVITDSGDVHQTVTVTVLEPTPPPSPTSTWTPVPPTPTNTPTFTPVPTNTPPPTSTPTPIPPVCGQIKLITSKTGPLLGSKIPVLIPCGCESKYVYLLQRPLSFGEEGAFYRIYDPVIENIPPHGAQEYEDDITQAITGWTRAEKINNCEACGLEPPCTPTLSSGPTDLQLVDVEVNGTPVAFEPFGLTLTVRNSGFAHYQPTTGAYQVKIEFVEGVPDKKTVFVFDSSGVRIDHWLSPQQLPALEPCADSLNNPCGEVKISISGLRFPATYAGSLHVTFTPKDDDTNPRNNVRHRNLSIGASDQSYRHCKGLAIKGLSLAPGMEEIMLANPHLTPEFLEMEDRVDSRCHGNEGCVANETAQFINSILERGLLEVVEKLTPIGFYAGLTKTIIEGLLEGGKCVTWCWKYIQALDDMWAKRGTAVNIAVVESPAFILVRNRAGQQTGFDDQGKVIQEIPDSYAFIASGDKVVIYPSNEQTVIRLKGTGPGEMNLRLLLAERNGFVHQLFYEKVPVDASMIAMIEGTDVQHTLKIDQNGDGQVDQSRPPDKTEKITAEVESAQQPTETPIAIAPLSSQPIQGPGGLCTVGIGLTLLPMFALRWRRFGKKPLD